MEQYIVALKAHFPNRQMSEDERKVMFTRAFGNDLDGHISYHLRIRVGEKTRTLGFTLAAGEFKELTITLP